MAAPAAPTSGGREFVSCDKGDTAQSEGKNESQHKSTHYCQVLSATASPQPVSIVTGRGRATRFKTARAFSL